MPTGVRRIAARTLEAALIRWVHLIVVVSESIAEWYRAGYGTQVNVIRNLPECIDHRCPPERPEADAGLAALTSSSSIMDY